MARAILAERLSPAAKLAAAHQKFARAVLLIYSGAAFVSVLALLAALVTDRAYDEKQTLDHLALETQVRAHSFDQHLNSLVAELGRLGVRSEIDLLDGDPSPEQSLLELSHRDSAFFNLGVAIVDRGGHVVWAEPSEFIPRHSTLADKPWFRETTLSKTPRVVAVNPEVSTDATVWLVAPILRADLFAGALIGGIDLARWPALGSSSDRPVATLLVTNRGAVVYPAAPPAYASQPEWLALFRKPLAHPFTRDVELARVATVVTGSPFHAGGVALLSVAPRRALFAPARHRMITRMVIGLSLALAPLGALVLLLRRSLGVFRRSEEQAVREDRVKMLGEAANQIAHEVRNSINGLRVGFDLILRGQPATNQRVVNELRAEIERLNGFAHQLMLFAKEPTTPRPSTLNLAEFVPEALSLTTELASELGVSIVLEGCHRPVLVSGDAVLLRIVLSNLVSNALDALATVPPGGASPQIVVAVQSSKVAEIIVADNGPGVPAEVEPRLFEPFVTSKPSGVGIGLALARKVALAHGGTLVLNRTAEGAEFRLTLPRLSEAATEGGAVNSPPPLPHDSP